jgi:polyribonucleotide nucleotidyltransferase
MANLKDRLHKPSRWEMWENAVFQLMEEKGKAVTPRDVLDAARPKNNPLHSYFDWNDRTAGEKFRVWQAQSLLRRITVKIVDKKGNETKTRGFVNVTLRERGAAPRRVYAEIKRVYETKSLRHQELEHALRDLESWCTRYMIYAELDEIREHLEREVKLFRARVLGKKKPASKKKTRRKRAEEPVLV